MIKDKNRKQEKPVLEQAGNKSFDEILKIVRSVQKEVEKRDYPNQSDSNVRVL